MSDKRKAHFDSLVNKEQTAEISAAPLGGIWELPDHMIDSVTGGADFTQAGGPGYVSFAQNFACFAQGIGNFSQWV